ncbi:MAG: ATP-binding protein [Deltaproteobacteria bacterium]|nr:ATP-binding protein [Deltaproteobacteria bacterium]
MRYLKEQILKDLNKKMVFVAGPRQVGKTTLAQSLVSSQSHYLNWDDDEDRAKILKKEFPKKSGILVLDEIHKYRGWRNYLKGTFDKLKAHFKILVTGSAKLDIYRFGGDSLQGRYYLLRMYPLSVAELASTQETLNDLMTYGGFPEPFYSQNKIDAKRWSLNYRTRLIREDILSLEEVSDLGRLELLFLRLPDLTGSPLSINGLREDLQVHHTTVEKWIQIFEKMYALFRLSPFGSPRIKSVKKEQKHYHFDWVLIEDESKRFENLVACHLLKWVHWKYDVFGETWELRYFRDPMGREVDFVVVDKAKPILFVECKLSDDTINPALTYLKSKFPETPAYQISLKGKKDYLNQNGIRVCPAIKLLPDWV